MYFGTLDICTKNKCVGLVDGRELRKLTELTVERHLGRPILVHHDVKLTVYSIEQCC